MFDNNRIPMTLDDFDTECGCECMAYDEGFSDGERVGHENGYNEGYNDALRYNVVLDSEMLDAIYDFKNQILDYRKEPWSENREHNGMIFEIHKGLMELTELWVMNQVWDYWSKRNEELGD